MDMATAIPSFCQQGMQLGQPQVIQIQTSNLTQVCMLVLLCFVTIFLHQVTVNIFSPFQTQGTPTIMCNEFGETIAIIETSGDLAEAIELYHTALEGGINMEAITVDNLQLL